MPKKPDYRYQPAGATPSQRKRAERVRRGETKSKSFVMPMAKPKGMSEIAEYVEGERGFLKEDEHTVDLVREFQEEVCKHSRRTEIASGPSFRLMRCTTCGDLKRLENKSAA